MSRLLTAFEVQNLEVEDDALIALGDPLAIQYAILPVAKTEAGLYLVLPLLEEVEDGHLLEDLRFVLDGKFTYDRAEQHDLNDKRRGIYDRVQSTVTDCGRFFHLGCPLKWASLTSTGNPDVRFCGVCHQHVYYARTFAERAAYAAAGNCTAYYSPPLIASCFDEFVGDDAVFFGDFAEEFGNGTSETWR